MQSFTYMGYTYVGYQVDDVENTYYANTNVTHVL